MAKITHDISTPTRGALRDMLHYGSSLNEIGVLQDWREVALNYGRRGARTVLTSDELADLIWDGGLRACITKGGSWGFVLTEKGLDMVEGKQVRLRNPGPPMFGEQIARAPGWKFGDPTEAKAFFTAGAGKLYLVPSKWFDGFEMIKPKAASLVYSSIAGAGSWENIGTQRHYGAGVAEGGQQGIRVYNPFYGSDPAAGRIVIETQPRIERRKAGKLWAVNGIIVETGEPTPSAARLLRGGTTAPDTPSTPVEPEPVAPDAETVEKALALMDSGLRLLRKYMVPR